jgi:hypothetical protein
MLLLLFTKRLVHSGQRLLQHDNRDNSAIPIVRQERRKAHRYPPVPRRNSALELRVVTILVSIVANRVSYSCHLLPLQSFDQLLQRPRISQSSMLWTRSRSSRLPPPTRLTARNPTRTLRISTFWTGAEVVYHKTPGWQRPTTNAKAVLRPARASWRVH